MSKFFRWLVVLVVGAVLLICAVVLALQHWVAGDDFRVRMETGASAALGLPVRLGTLDVAVWPLPALALTGASVLSKPPVTLGRLEVRPSWFALLGGRLEMATLVLRQAVLPQQAVDSIMLSVAKNKTGMPAGKMQASDWLPQRAVLEDVSWLSLKGARTTIDAEMLLGADRLPDTASLRVVKGNLNGLRMELARLGASQWVVRAEVGGGTVRGQLDMVQLPSTKGGLLLSVRGKLETRGVEVSAVTAPNKLLTGRLDASTTLNARAATSGALLEALQTQTRFTVKDAVLNGVDLVKAVQTVGLSRGGQTRLNTLVGEVQSQGRALPFKNLAASSGALSATGNVAVALDKVLSGRVSVNPTSDSRLGNVLSGAVGVPLLVSGTLEAPEVTLTRGAMLGAAVGTVLMPGVGTGAGIQLGDRIGEGLKKLFGK